MAPSATISSSSNVALQLARRFSSVLSLSSPSTAATTATTTAIKSFSTTTSTSTTTATTTYSNRMMIHKNGGDGGYCHSNISNNRNNFVVIRSMATSKIDAKNAKRLKLQQKKKKNAQAGTTSTAVTATATNSNDGNDDDDEKESSLSSSSPLQSESTSGLSSSTAAKSPFLQHEEWVKFQQSITVSGFQTGQTTTATVLKKSRGGKQARRKREQELARLGGVDGTTTPGGGKISAVAAKFPAIRYSTEETEELLKLAYETLPTRDGKRGSRSKQRQENRWKKVRRIRSDYKAQLLQAHYRRMEHRKYKRDRTKEMMVNAIEQRQNDSDYQKSVLQRYMGLYGNSNKDNENQNQNENSSSVLSGNENKI